ncbi:hypothetical protein DIZ31_20785 [Escherichia coli]|nr:hypothetical protein DIZ31_20785 [Escherichia coli]
MIKRHGVYLITGRELRAKNVSGPRFPWNFSALTVAIYRAYFHERRSLNNFHRDRVITFEQIAE